MLRIGSGEGHRHEHPQGQLHPIRKGTTHSQSIYIYTVVDPRRKLGTTIEHLIGPDMQPLLLGTVDAERMLYCLLLGIFQQMLRHSLSLGFFNDYFSCDLVLCGGMQSG